MILTSPVADDGGAGEIAPSRGLVTKGTAEREEKEADEDEEEKEEEEEDGEDIGESSYDCQRVSSC
jgi:hypothetical protein